MDQGVPELPKGQGLATLSAVDVTAMAVGSAERAGLTDLRELQRDAAAAQGEGWLLGQLTPHYCLRYDQLAVKLSFAPEGPTLQALLENMTDL